MPEASSPGAGRESFAGVTCARCGRTNSSPLICCVAGSPAKTSASPAEARESTGPGLGSGGSFTVSSVTFDQDWCSWRTCQRSFTGEWVRFSGPWPRSGTMRNGTASPQQPSAPLTDVIDSSSWPTPVADGDRTTDYDQNGRSLGAEARRRPWPTPQARDWKGPWSTGDGTDLPSTVRMFPTPVAADARRKSQTYVRGNLTLVGAVQRNLKDGDSSPPVRSGTLNPLWVEWLMGFPPEWTVCEHSATRSFPKWRIGSACESSARSRGDAV